MAHTHSDNNKKVSKVSLFTEKEKERKPARRQRKGTYTLFPFSFAAVQSHQTVEAVAAALLVQVNCSEKKKKG